MSNNSNKWSANSDKEMKKLASSSGWMTGSSEDCGTTISSRSTKGKRVNVDFGDEDFYCQPAKKQSREDDRKPAAVMVDTPSSCSPAATNDARPSARVLLEVDSAKSMLESHIRCKKCRGPVLVTFPTICIASGIRIECTNKIMCKFVDLTPPACAGMAEMNLASDELPRNNIFYAANILFVVGSMASGDGGKEAERTLGFLGLPNSSSMEKRSFPGLERLISDTIHGCRQ